MSTRICRFEKSTLLRLEHQNTVRVGAQCAPSHINGIRRDGARRAPDAAWPFPLSGRHPGSPPMRAPSDRLRAVSKPGRTNGRIDTSSIGP
jgi:hypothetical protein